MSRDHPYAPWALGLCLLAGCSLLNRPNRSGLQQPDAGMDADRDAEMDAGEGGLPTERCDNGADDDRDGFTDCEDRADCAGAPQCCEEASEAFSCPAGTTGVWCPAWQGRGWNDWRTDVVRSGTALQLGGEGREGVFGTSGCLPLAKGARIDVRFGFGNPAACEASRCRVAVVLTAAEDPRSGSGRFYEDLGVEYTNDSGRWALRVTQGGRLLRERNLERAEGNPVTLRISVGPSAEPGGAAVLAATVQRDPATRAEEVVTALPFVQLEDLLPDCADRGPGLRLALEGSGPGTPRIERLVFGETGCANPAIFSPPAGDALALCLPPQSDGRCVPLSFPTETDQPRWAVEDGTRFGVLAHPALAGYCDPSNGCLETTGNGPWLAAVAVTDADPALGLLGRIGYATETLRLSDARWNEPSAWEAVEDEAPALGGTNPTCLPGEGCSQSDPSVEHPSLLPLPPWESNPLVLLAVLNEEEVGARKVLQVRQLDGQGPAVTSGPPRLRICPKNACMRDDSAKRTDCTALRAPLLMLPAGASPSWDDRAWVLFGCERDEGTTLQTVLLDLLRAEASEARSVQLAGSDASPLDLYGLVDLGGEVEFLREGRSVVRIWALLSDPRTGRSQLVLFEGAAEAPDASPNVQEAAFPPLRPYPVAPLATLASLQAASPDLATFCAGGSCRLEGFDVAAAAKPQQALEGTATTLRFLFAVRRGLRSRLFPFEQRWPAPPSPPEAAGP